MPFFCVPTPTTASTDLRFGINYYAVNNHYEQLRLTDAVLDRDFSLFQNQGIKYVILQAVWSYINRNETMYAPEAIPDLIRVCDFADKYGLKVIIDFHTRMNSTNWTMPSWLTDRNFETVLHNNTAREEWLSFLGYVASGLNDVSNLEGWQMMNEPGWCSTSPVSEWIVLWNQMRDVFKSYSDRPVSIRFDEALVRSDYFNLNPQICDVCDFLSYNWYYGDNVAELELLRQYALVHGKKVMISEFGTDVDTGVDDATVTAQYLASIEYFRSYGVEACTAFYWQADYYWTSPSPPGTDYNLALDVAGTPRPAFYCLTNEPTVTPTPTPAPALSSTVVSVDDSLLTIGNQVTVQATITTLGSPTGPVTFKVSSDGGNTFVPFGAQKSSPATGIVLSDPFTVTAPGTYYFKAVYDGNTLTAGSESDSLAAPLVVAGSIFQAPEYPFGAFAALMACFVAAFVVYKKRQ